MRTIKNTPAQLVISFLLIVTLVQSLPKNGFAGEPTAAVDSSFVAAFLELPDGTVKERRKQAEQLVKQAMKEKNGFTRTSLLVEALDADPSNTHHWLALAENEILMGYEAEAETALTTARLTLKFVRGKPRRAAVRDYSLAMAWWNYRMAQWKKGVDWGQRALKYDAGLAGHLILGLNNTKFVKSWKKTREAGHVFRPFDNGGNRRANLSWIYFMNWHLNVSTFDPVDTSAWLKRSTHHFERDVLRWRDYGMYCEGHEDGILALGYYEKSIQSMPVPDGGWFTRHEREIPVLDHPMGPMPFWINSDGAYVTGSLLAYLGYARDRMVAEQDPTGKDVWAERVLAYNGRIVQRYQFHPWPALWNSEALLELGQIKKALAEVRYARDKFRLQKIDCPALNRVHGRILLVQKKYGKAIPMVRQASIDFPEDATCWADLGILESVAGDKIIARKAFDRALELDNDLTAAWYNRGLLSMKEGNPADAVSDMERANELVPENLQIAEDLSRVRRIAENSPH